MTERTKPGRGSDRTKHSGASIKPTRRSVYSIDDVPIDQIYSSIKAEKPDVHLAPAAADSGGVEMADPPGARVPGGHGVGDVEEPRKAPRIRIVRRPAARGQPLERPPPRPLRLHSVKDSANYCKVSTQTIRRAIKAGRSIGRASRSGSTKPTSSSISLSSRPSRDNSFTLKSR
jgi:hypothetical protein